MFSILVLLFMSISQVRATSLLTGTNDQNSTALINNRRDVKEIDVLRQLINQETLIRVAAVRDVRATVDDVNSVKRSMASTEITVSYLQLALNTLKNEVDSLRLDKTVAQKAETLQRQLDALRRQNTIITQKIENIERQVERYQDNTLTQTVETLKTQVDSFIRKQRRENKKIAMDCQTKIQESEQKFNRNVTEIFELLKNETSQTIKKDFRIKTDCEDHFQQGNTQSGVYRITPFGNDSQISVYCDMVTEGGGWTTIQKRVVGSGNFNRTWAEYKKGFGNPYFSHWIGNDAIHQLTKGSISTLYVSFTVGNDTLYEFYQQFSVNDESDNYRLFLGGPATGTLGDMMLNTNLPKYYDLSGMYFTTLDRDNDKAGYNCAAGWGGGWWFNACYGPWYLTYWYPTVERRSSAREAMMMIKRHKIN